MSLILSTVKSSLGSGAKLALLHAAAFVGLGVSLPFFPVWLESRQLAPSTIGLILSIPMLVRIVVTAPLMSLVDRGLSPRRLLAMAYLTVAASYALLLIAPGAAAIAAIVAVAAVAQAPIVPASDLVTLERVRREPRLDYGRLRLWGSVAFLVSNIVAGHLLATFEPSAVVWILAFLALAALAVVRVAVPAPGRSEDARRSPMREPSAARWPMGLWLVIAAAACIQASHAGVYAFGSLHWREIGFANTTIGYLWATGVLAEIVVFACCGEVVGRSSTALFFIMTGAGAAILRFAALATEPGLAITVGLQALHGLSFGATHLGAMAALAALAPPDVRGRAQGTLSSAQALAMAGATVLSGAAFRAGGPVVFLAMVPVAILGLLLAVAAARTLPQPQREGEGGSTTLPS